MLFRSQEEKDEPAQDLKIESLDVLFEDEPDEKPTKVERKEPVKISAQKEEEKPILPQLDDETPSDEYDLQKELEAKFDELFGPIDEED